VSSSAALRRFAFAFGTAFAACYAVAVGRQLALFTVFPSLGIVLPGTVQTRDFADPALGFLAPAMYWYGWTATAALGAGVVGLCAALIPEAWTKGFGADGCGWFPSQAWRRGFLPCLGFGVSRNRVGSIKSCARLNVRCPPIAAVGAQYRVETCHMAKVRATVDIE
jgi:hypothetical protein